MNAKNNVGGPGKHKRKKKPVRPPGDNLNDTKTNNPTVGGCKGGRSKTNPRTRNKDPTKNRNQPHWGGNKPTAKRAERVNPQVQDHWTRGFQKKKPQTIPSLVPLNAKRKGGGNKTSRKRGGVGTLLTSNKPPWGGAQLATTKPTKHAKKVGGGAQVSQNQGSRENQKTKCGRAPKRAGKTLGQQRPP